MTDRCEHYQTTRPVRVCVQETTLNIQEPEKNTFMCQIKLLLKKKKNNNNQPARNEEWEMRCFKKTQACWADTPCRDPLRHETLHRKVEDLQQSGPSARGREGQVLTQVKGTLSTGRRPQPRPPQATPTTQPRPPREPSPPHHHPHMPRVSHAHRHLTGTQPGADPETDLHREQRDCFVVALTPLNFLKLAAKPPPRHHLTGSTVHRTGVTAVR